MPLITKSRGSIWRVWSGTWRVGGKDHKKTVGVNVAINIRTDKLPSDFSEERFINDVAALLVGYASRYDSQA